MLNRATQLGGIASAICQLPSPAFRIIQYTGDDNYGNDNHEALLYSYNQVMQRPNEGT